MKVDDLKKLLAGLPPDADVLLEGCDCVNECIGLSLDEETLYLRVSEGIDSVSSIRDLPVVKTT